MRYEDLQIYLLRLLKSFWNRVLALDIETHVVEQRYLENDRILAVGIARRVSGDLLDSDGIEVKTIFLEDDTDDSEIELLKKLGAELSRIKPLCVVGYGIRQYDIPLLAIKKQRYGNLMKQFREFWKLVDLIESAVHIDLYHILKYKGYRKFDDVVHSVEFAMLPLKRTKSIIAKERAEKAHEIYRLWRENREKLEEYVEGDVHDSLLIAEKLLQEAS